jgi:predicted  nucleic acid-binding Zn-ribbon protein
VDHLYAVLAILTACALTVGAILGAGWRGLKALRGQIREDVKADRSSEEFRAEQRKRVLEALDSREGRAIVREESVDAIRAEGVDRHLRQLVGEAMSGAVQPLMKSITDLDDRLKKLDDRVAKHGARIGALERWRSGAEERISGEFASMRRLLSAMYKKMKQTGLVKGEDAE